MAVTEIQQDSYIQFDEAGTEAAAKTEIQMRIYAPSPSVSRIKEFTANRPFMFFVVDQQGVMYFAGKISQPVWE